MIFLTTKQNVLRSRNRTASTTLHLSTNKKSQKRTNYSHRASRVGTNVTSTNSSKLVRNMDVTSTNSSKLVRNMD